jgi:hypothetical protein
LLHISQPSLLYDYLLSILFQKPYLLAHLSLHPYREREAQLEVEQQRKVAELKDQFAAESKQWQKEIKAVKDTSQQKLNYLAKL